MLNLLTEQPEIEKDVEQELATEAMREQYLRAAAVVRTDGHCGNPANQISGRRGIGCRP
jgi:hypothetical protein